MSAPAYVLKFQDPQRSRHVDWETNSDASEVNPSGDKISGCQVLGWVVVGLLTIYILTHLFIWFMGYNTSGCASDGASSKVASVASRDPIALKSDDELMRCAQKQAPTVVMFHAPWCSHCKEALPQYKAAARASNAECYTADCQNDIQAFTNYGIKGFPTFLRFDGNGEATEYKGPRTANALTLFINGE
jgi:thiol-disulfide isomerase/thioredoxin